MSATVKISQLPVTATLSAGDVLPVVSAGATQQITLTNLFTAGLSTQVLSATFVDLTSTQTIGGAKSFSQVVTSPSGFVAVGSTYGPTGATIAGLLAVVGGNSITVTGSSQGLTNTNAGLLLTGTSANRGVELGNTNAAGDIVRLTSNSVALAKVDNTGAFVSGSGQTSTYGPTSAVIAGPLSVSGQTTTITSGSGAPSATQPSGSLYLRTEGSAGTRLYVSAGGGSWTPVPGV